jgi:hypothetical protein
MKRLGVLLLLAGCATPVPPDYSAGVIVTSSGELGMFTTRVYVDDRVMEKQFNPDPKLSLPETSRVVPGAYARTMAVIAAEGPAAIAANTGGVEVCADYGFDMVRIEPATPAFDSLSDDCPDAALTRLMRQVLAAIEP